MSEPLGPAKQVFITSITVSAIHSRGVHNIHLIHPLGELLLLLPFHKLLPCVGGVDVALVGALLVQCATVLYQQGDIGEGRCDSTSQQAEAVLETPEGHLYGDPGLAMPLVGDEVRRVGVDLVAENGVALRDVDAGFDLLEKHWLCYVRNQINKAKARTELAQARALNAPPCHLVSLVKVADIETLVKKPTLCNVFDLFGALMGIKQPSIAPVTFGIPASSWEFPRIIA
ncbi:hypothetical protein BDK51DRAFT_52021 [Blyttiomyces helicus]|uniref:Uncharacterized protein n=1 Tax=Blyttiomyces helicus TaxID=388810 RepID=A0A4P9W5R7_9FUNG|nr:hypothetical protein BDK51DRAFT_52021 [Blyttiomyces helicus]|eukprot:RKO87302.1 hypothetical protein BDK51DRAFT_52021 [Blyttiomyces helicus]